MNLSHIRQEADHRLQEHEVGFRKLVLIHTAVTAGLSLLLMVITYLSQHVTPKGGLSNMGTQNLLATGQTLLQMANFIVLPFWNAGLVFSTLQLLRGKDYPPSTLTAGFHRWGPIITSLLIRGVIYFFVIFGCYFISSIVLSILPLPAALINDLTAFLESPSFSLSTGVWIFLGIYLVIYVANLLILLVPKLYLHRLVTYRIMDDDPCGGFQSVALSGILMRGKRKNLLLLDLSFWWFYLLELGISVLSIGNLILEWFGIALPIGTELAAWVFPIVALLVRLVLYWYAKPKLALTYALFYQRVLDESLKEPKPTQPKQMPCKY